MLPEITAPAPASDEGLCFGKFRLLPRQRLLLASGIELPLNGRAFDILTLLVERAGEFVSNAELMAHAWPHSVVEGISVRVHIAALRRLLEGRGNVRCIENRIGHGYRFIACVSREVAVPRHRPPAALSSLVGRAQAIDALTTLVQGHRWVTAVGAAGAGKSVLALAAANGLTAHFGSGACVVDLATITDLPTLTARIAQSLELPALAGVAPAALIHALQYRHLLVVLDNCDLALGAVACLTEPLLAGTARLHVLTTSREGVGGASEQQFRVTPLSLAASIDLFVARVAAVAPSAAAGGANADDMAELCRRLAGIPLVIELAAAQVATWGLRGLASRLDAHLLRMINGRRTADARHRTWRAALDWTYGLLGEAERWLLTQLTAFDAAFTLEDVVALAVRWQGTARQTTECLLSLASKSLITTELRGNTAEHRLLEPIRVYARDNLRTEFPSS
jgi:predicted ATPase/DNA-binding winged helix-turn-helix (wHTH) protein